MQLRSTVSQTSLDGSSGEQAGVTREQEADGGVHGVTDPVLGRWCRMLSQG